MNKARTITWKQTTQVPRNAITLEDFDSLIEEIRGIAYPKGDPKTGVIEIEYQLDVKPACEHVTNGWAVGFDLAKNGPELGSPLTHLEAGFRLQEMVQEVAGFFEIRGFHAPLNTPEFVDSKEAR